LVLQKPPLHDAPVQQSPSVAQAPPSPAQQERLLQMKLSQQSACALHVAPEAAQEPAAHLLPLHESPEQQSASVAQSFPPFTQVGGGFPQAPERQTSTPQQSLLPEHAPPAF
jgi:hypothetical protein